MATGLCRFDAYTIIAAQLDGDGEYAVDACNNPATHTAIVQRIGDGLAVRVDVQVCARHDAELHVAAGYERSIRLRVRST